MEPEDIENKEFLVSLRGYDREEVDAFLREIAEEIRALKSGAAAPAGPSDPETTYRRVGEETAGILVAAEEAGRQMRERAQREAAELVADARARADDVARQAAADRQEAEEDLRKLREARALLATQLQDVRQRLDEVISRLAGPIEAPPVLKRARTKKAEAAAAPVARPAAKAAAPAAPTEVRRPAPPPAEPAPEPVASPAPAPARPAAAPARPAPVSPALVAPEKVASPTTARLQQLLEEARREREQARREIQDVLTQAQAPPAPAATVTPPATAKAPGVVAVSEVVEILARRDKTLADVPAAAARRLKRVLQEDQNDLLDRIRTSRGKGTFDQDVSPLDAQLIRFREGLRESLESAFVTGRQLAGAEGEGKSSSIVGDLIAKQIVNPLRREVGRVVEAGIQAQDTPTSIAGRASDVFRVWKGVRTELLGEGLAYSAFHHGMLDAWREQRTGTKRWVASPDEGDCPKEVCSSNAAAGAVTIDGPFPSGHLAPPAHGGCTCSLVAE